MAYSSLLHPGAELFHRLPDDAKLSQANAASKPFSRRNVGQRPSRLSPLPQGAAAIPRPPRHATIATGHYP
jgi:hypothetical protein